MRGLALSAEPSAGATIWSFRLRQGVRFQDGAPLNSSAVAANGRRWLSTAQGQAMLPDLFAVDAPRPDLARFFLERSDPSFPRRLRSPRTGLVSPRALTDRSGEGAALNRTRRTGTGAYELRERDRTEALLARYVNWWGIGRGLGPALDQVRLRSVPEPSERFSLLASGDVEAADELGPAQVRRARRHPLLEILPAGRRSALGLERSVRGITSAREIPALSSVWVTRLGPG